MVRIVKKLKTKNPLMKLNKEKNGKNIGKVYIARAKLEDAQSKLIKDPLNPQLQDNVKSAREAYINLLSFEESFLKEKSKIKEKSLCCC